MRAGIVCFAVSCMVAFAAASDSPQMLGAFGDWKLFRYGSAANALCYIASVPVHKSGNYKKRGEPFAMVTQRSAGVDEVSAHSGYDFRQASKVVVTVGNDKFELFTKGDRAWAYDASQDNRMIGSMARAGSMLVRGASQRGSFSADTYSLKGFAPAHREMKAKCR